MALWDKKIHVASRHMQMQKGAIYLHITMEELNCDISQAYAIRAIIMLLYLFMLVVIGWPKKGR